MKKCMKNYMKKDVKNHMKKYHRKEDVKKGEGTETLEE
jgi:hypothetical protein